jgi:hypothetical protein
VRENDVIRLSFTEGQVSEAYQWAEYSDIKNDGQNTVNLSNTKNVTGFLGHLAVEQYIADLGLEHVSTLREKYHGGDPFDIQYEDDFLEIKSHRKTYSPEYFYNQTMLVFDHHQVKQESHYVFTYVEPDWTGAHIYGIIEADDFWDQSEAAILNSRSGQEIPYHFVKSRHLRPFRDYLLHLNRLRM